jgi:ubiquinone/menaquinone biosynthesis C-methylase UbiE
MRHIADLGLCFDEFRRVLKQGGTLLLLEVSSPARTVFKATLAPYLGRAVPRLSQWATRQPKVGQLMNCHWQAMEDCVAPTVILDTMSRAGFARLDCESWFDLFRSYAGQKVAA